MEKNSDELMFEGNLQSVISTYRRIENSPTTGQLLVPQEHMATLLEGLRRQASQIETLQSQAVNNIELQEELQKAQQTILDYEQREAESRTREIRIGRKASEIVGIVKAAHSQTPD